MQGEKVLEMSGNLKKNTRKVREFCCEIHFSSNLSILILKFFWRSMPPDPLKARSYVPISKTRLLLPKIGSRRSDGPISRFRFCGENFNVFTRPDFRNQQKSDP